MDMKGVNESKFKYRIILTYFDEGGPFRPVPSVQNF